VLALPLLNPSREVDSVRHSRAPQSPTVERASSDEAANRDEANPLKSSKEAN
jgi:hypothetical protein